MNLKGFRRIPQRGVIAGVCAGIAEYFDWNVRLLRAAIVIIAVFTAVFPFVVAYLVLWYVMEPLSPAEAAADPSDPGAPPVRPTPMSEIKERFARLDDRLRQIEECVTDREFDLRREFKKLEA